MKRRLLTVVSGVCLFLVVCHAEADAPESKPAPSVAESKYKNVPVVFVDVRYLLENYPPLKTQLDDWNKDMHALEDHRKTEQGEIRALKRELPQYKEDTPDYLRLENEIVKRETDSTGSWKSGRNQLLRRRARLFLDAYQVIGREVKQFLEENEIGAVMNYDGDPDPMLKDAFSISKLAAEYAAIAATGDEASYSGPSAGYIKDRQITPEKVEQLIGRPIISVNPDRDITILIRERIINAAREEKAAVGDKKKPKE